MGWGRNELIRGSTPYVSTHKGQVGLATRVYVHVFATSRKSRMVGGSTSRERTQTWLRRWNCTTDYLNFCAQAAGDAFLPKWLASQVPRASEPWTSLSSVGLAGKPAVTGTESPAETTKAGLGLL